MRQHTGFIYLELGFDYYSANKMQTDNRNEQKDSSPLFKCEST